jgi:DNA-binding CsgD family transcriptional regulator/predicted ester cyclase
MKQNTKEQISIVRHIYEKFMGEGDLSSYDQFITEDARVHCPASWQEIHSSPFPELSGRENTKKIDLEYAQAFQFIDVEIEELLSINDKVFVRWNCGGIHRGSFFGMPETHRQFAVGGQTLFRFGGTGQINESWQSWDMQGLLRQIGWHPAAATPLDDKDLNKKLRRASRLSERERDCLKLLIQGKTAKDTAAILFVSPRTVEYYFENIKDKLNSLTKKELFSIARLYETHHLL